MGTVALSSPTNGPVAGEVADNSVAHFLTLAPRDDAAFVTTGGDGQITRIDTRLRRATKTVSVPTALHEGGYLTVIESGGKPLTDLVAR